MVGKSGVKGVCVTSLRSQGSPEHVAMQLVLRAVKQQGWVEHRQVVGVKQNNFCKAGCIQGEGLEGVAFDVCWLVMGGVG